MVIVMGLFDSIKKSKEINKKAEWRVNNLPTVVKLNKDHILLYNSAAENVIYYKDIVNVEVVPLIVNIRTTVKTFSLQSRKVRGGSDKARELHAQIVEKMSEVKSQ